MKELTNDELKNNNENLFEIRVDGNKNKKEQTIKKSQLKNEAKNDIQKKNEENEKTNYFEEETQTLLKQKKKDLQKN